jgi:hypothetical protein
VEAEQEKQSWKILSGSALKILAIVSMLVDHLAAYLWCGEPWCTEVLFNVGHKEISAYVLMRMFGRIAFPLFAFLLVEGFQHTRSRKRYGIQLFIFALLSEIPYNLVHGGWFYHGQNIFFTLLLGYLGLCALERFKDDNKKLIPSLLGLLVVSVLLRADYGCSGYGFILLLYVLRNQELVRAVIGCCVLGSRWMAGTAFIPIALYNGKRGFVRGPVGKYFFYLFYPLHLLIIWLLAS